MRRALGWLWGGQRKAPVIRSDLRCREAIDTRSGRMCLEGIKDKVGLRLAGVFSTLF